MTKFIERKKFNTSHLSIVLTIIFQPNQAFFPSNPKSVTEQPQPVYKQPLVDKQQPVEDHQVEGQPTSLPLKGLTRTEFQKEFAQIMENFNPWTSNIFKPP